MICYLWFANSTPERAQQSSSGSPPFFTRGSSPSTLQLVATPNFVQFMQKLLETTQVSQSVMVLSLHYIHRLKERNRFTPAQSGSEFRIAVAGLMMANKFLDEYDLWLYQKKRDYSLLFSNTYTNKTWSEVSGIDLEEINRMEREFLIGVDFNLYVDKSTYESWLNLLKGLIMAKERDSKHFRKSRLAHQSRLAATPHPSSTGPATRTYVSSSRQKPPVYRHRARSTSPTSRTISCPQTSHNNVSYPEPLPPPASAIPYASTNTCQYLSAQNSSPTPRSGSKRSAQDAFSPTSASLSQLPNKRPLPTSLQIPECKQSVNSSGSTSSHSNSPLDGLQSFSKMSINTMGGHSPLETSSPWAENGTKVATTARKTVVPETLVTAYMLDEAKKSTAPQVGFPFNILKLGAIDVYSNCRHCTSINCQVPLCTTRLSVKNPALEKRFWGIINPRHQPRLPLHTYMEIWMHHRMDHYTILMLTGRTLVLITLILPLLKFIRTAVRQPDSSNNHNYQWCQPWFKARQQVLLWPLMLILNTAIYHISTTMFGPDRRLLPFPAFLKYPQDNNGSIHRTGSVIVLAMDMDMGTRRSSSNQIHACIQRSKQMTRSTTLTRTQVLLMTCHLDLLATLTVNSISTTPRRLSSNNIYVFLSLPRHLQTLVLQALELNFTLHPRRARRIPHHFLIPMGTRIHIIPDKVVMQAGWGCETMSGADLNCNWYLFLLILGLFFCLFACTFFFWHDVKLTASHFAFLC